MLREAERVLDHEIAAIEQLDQKTAQAITLAISGLTLLVILATLAGERTSPSFVAFVTLAGTANGVAVYLLVHAYHGRTKRAHTTVGPSPTWLAGSLSVERTLAEHYASVLLGYAEYHEGNQALMKRFEVHRARGVNVLLVSAALYGLAAFRLALAATYS